MKTQLIRDIEKLVSIGVKKSIIAGSMKLSKQAFNYRFSLPRFTVDQEHLFYKKYRTML